MRVVCEVGTRILEGAVGGVAPTGTVQDGGSGMVWALLAGQAALLRKQETVPPHSLSGQGFAQLSSKYVAVGSKYFTILCMWWGFGCGRVCSWFPTPGGPETGKFLGLDQPAYPPWQTVAH